MILEVTPRVNLGGRITLDLSQEVTDVDRVPSHNSLGGIPVPASGTSRAR